MWLKLSLIGIITLCYIHQSDGKYVKGSLDTKQDWFFLSRFCFLSEVGSLNFKFTFPITYESPKILLYYDDPGQWASVYGMDLTCDQKMSVLAPENNQIITLEERYSWSGCSPINMSGAPYLVCEGGRTFRSSRERWWFIAISRCSPKDGLPLGLNITYELFLQNGDNTFLDKEFSADEFYILPIDLTFLLVFILMFIATIVVAGALHDKQLFHTTYKMYMVSIGFETFRLFLMTVGYGRFANTGVDQYATKLCGRISGAIGDLVFLLMLILMAKGFTITRGRLSTSGSIKIAVFMTLYTLVYSVVFIYNAAIFDPGLVLYFFESPGGYGLIGLRILAWIWFCYAIFFTLKHHSNKSTFYIPFFIMYTIWFWAGPIVILIAMHAMDLWVREKVAEGSMNAVSLVGHAIFLFLTLPFNANSNFPYHVRTTQIGAMDSTPHSDSNGLTSTMGNGTSNGFGMHSYSVPNGTGPNFTDLFVTSQTRSDKSETSQLNRLPPLESSSVPVATTAPSVLPPIKPRGGTPPIKPRGGTPPSYENLFAARP